MRRVPSRLGLLLVLASPALGSPGDDFFCVTIDSGADRLAMVDSATGTETILGGIGLQLSNSSLAVYDDRLFLIDSIWNVRVDFYELDPASGTVLSWVPLTLGGNLVGWAEGLAATSTGLLVGYRGTGTDRFSNSLGDLGLGGVITDPTDFAADTDFDGLDVDSSGRIFSTDQFYPETRSAVYAVDRSTSTVTWLADHAAKFSALAFTETDHMFALDRATNCLRELDPSNGSEIAVFPLDPAIQLRALAAIPSGFQALRGNYGVGFAGSLGVPTLRASDPPVLGSTISVEVGNSLGQDTPAVLFAGLQPASTPGSWGGQLLVVPLTRLVWMLPAAGFSLPAPLPADPAWCGISLFLQVLEVDGGAPGGVSNSAGLELRLGN